MPDATAEHERPEIGDVRIQDVVGIKEMTPIQRMLASQAFWVTVALAFITALMSYLQPDAFATYENFYNISRNFAFIGIMAIGMVTVIITGGIDLSVGSLMGLVGVACGVVLEAGYPWYAAVIAGLAAGMAAGAVNGWLIAYVKLSPFVVTLGMLSFARSLAVVLSGNRMIYNFGPGGAAFKWIGGGAFRPRRRPPPSPARTGARRTARQGSRRRGRRRRRSRRRCRYDTGWWSPAPSWSAWRWRRAEGPSWWAAPWSWWWAAPWSSWSWWWLAPACRGRGRSRSRR